MSIYYYSSPVGILRIESMNKRIYRIEFVSVKRKNSADEAVKICAAQLHEYFSVKRKQFDLPIFVEGTEFERKVWKEISKIKYGETVSYAQIASRIGNPSSYRAVANACGKNNIPIIIPCHRVVGKNSIGGYSSGILKKKKLLKLESSQHRIS